MSVNKAKTAISLLSVMGVAFSLLLPHGLASSVPVLLCALAAVGILYHKLPELSNVSEDNPKAKTLRSITVFNVIVAAGLIVFTVLMEKEIIRLSEESARFVLPVIFSVLMIVFGNAAPKIPHNRYTGLRLPWTVSDEETWIVAHRILGYLSFPCGILSLAGVSDLRASVYIPMTLLTVWILVPAALSYLFFCRKWYFKRNRK